MRKRPCGAATRPASTSSAPPRSILARSRHAWRSGLLARAHGDRPAALQAMKEVFALPPYEDEREDPWWGYHKAHVRNTDALLDELRRPFLKGSKP